MAVNINGTGKLPLGYFLVDGLDRDKKNTIVSHCIKKVSDIGARIVPFDGAPSNVATANILGANSNFNISGMYRRKCLYFYDTSHAFGEKTFN